MAMRDSLPSLPRSFDSGCGVAQDLHAEGVATAGVMPVRPSLATLLASHILRDGEVVLLIVRPSLWFILLSSLRFLAGALILIIIARVMSLQTHVQIRSYVELCVSAITARIMWATLQWMSRLYILTDMRILTLAGVFQIDVFDCPLRKIARTRVVRDIPDRLTYVGSIEIIPNDPDSPFGIWQTIDRPFEINEQIVATISRAKGNAE
jgi:hypothetical protein